MSIRTPEELKMDFETLADEKHHPSVYRASERIRAHLAALEERHAREIAAARADGYAAAKAQAVATIRQGISELDKMETPTHAHEALANLQLNLLRRCIDELSAMEPEAKP